MSRLLSLAVLAILAYASAAPAVANDDPPVSPTQIKTLAVFKNGLGFFYRSGEANLQGGWTGLAALPAAAHGALWIGTSDPAGVREVVSYNRKVKTPYDSMSISELIDANVGRDATLKTSISGWETLKGTIHSVPAERKADQWGPAPGMPDPRYPQPVAIFHFKTDDGIIAMPRSAVTSILFPDAHNSKTVVEREVPSAKVRLDKASGKVDLSLAYLQKGVNWSPSYLVNLKDESTAEITLEAVLSNDVEDLENVEVSFVVGYPNFAFSDILSPMVLSQSVQDFMGRLAGGASAGAMSSVMMQTSNFASYSHDASPTASWSPESTYSTTGPMAGESNEDLFFYRQPGVTLKRGDRARYTVFTQQSPYRHIYEWNVPDTMNIDDRGYRSGNESPIDPNLQVWHVLRIENKTKLPWTTAPALVVNGSMPVAQDTLHYCPPEGRTTLKLTVATDVRGETEQVELSREPITIGETNYFQVEVAGKLKVRNYKAKAVDMRVVKGITGEVLESSADSKVTRVVKRLAAANPTSEVAWEFNLEPGKERVLEYKYKTLIAR